ncbi:hypothetical protein ZWY2020_039943 [Hordeum vulgare]|nr:hypothetical protein ZWY2020_039943 [Hordeum vulgare]
MEAEAEYEAALEEALQQALEASRLEEDACWDEVEQALALSAVTDSVHTPLFLPPPPPSPPIQPKPATRKRSSPPPTWPEEAYTWTGRYREWEQADGEEHIRYKAMLQRDAEALRLEERRRSTRG